MNFIRHLRNHKHIPYSDKEMEGGFTYIELILVGLIITLLAGGVWAVYYSVMNTYYEEQRTALIHYEGERMINLMTHGGHYKGRRIYGLNSSNPVPGYPNVGQVKAINFPNTSSPDSDDYRIEFALESSDGNPRYAEFSVEFNGKMGPTSRLWFRLRTSSLPSDADENYDVLLTENLLQRKKGTDPKKFGDYDKTWFKAQLLPKDTASDYYAGMRISFYLVDTTQPLIYNYNLDRELITPISDPAQRERYLGAIPYPKYFSTSVHFMNRE